MEGKIMVVVNNNGKVSGQGNQANSVTQKLVDQEFSVSNIKYEITSLTACNKTFQGNPLFKGSFYSKVGSADGANGPCYFCPKDGKLYVIQPNVLSSKAMFLVTESTGEKTTYYLEAEIPKKAPVQPKPVIAQQDSYVSSKPEVKTQPSQPSTENKVPGATKPVGGEKPQPTKKTTYLDSLSVAANGEKLDPSSYDTLDEIMVKPPKK
jgi:hypothetical protein